MVMSIRIAKGSLLAFLLLVTVSAVHADEALTARNKAIVRDFYSTVFIKRNVDAAPRFRCV